MKGLMASGIPCAPLVACKTASATKNGGRDRLNMWNNSFAVTIAAHDTTGRSQTPGHLRCRSVLRPMSVNSTGSLSKTYSQSRETNPKAINLWKL